MITIAEVLQQWQAAGVFDYVLPFLLIFAVVFGILTSTGITGKQKSVHVIIALVIALMAIKLGLVPEFFTELFPRLGVGLAVILSLLIMTGLFIHEDDAKYWMYGIAAVAVVVWIIVLVGTSNSVGWFGFGSGDIGNYAGLIIAVVLVIGVIIAVVSAGSSGGGSGKFKRHESAVER